MATKRVEQLKRKWAPAFNGIYPVKAVRKNPKTPREKAVRKYEVLCYLKDELEILFEGLLEKDLPSVITTPLLNTVDNVLYEVEDYLDYLDKKLFP